MTTTDTKITLDTLRQRERDRSVAEVAALEATRLRNAAIRDLLDQGVRQADIARALDVTRGRVSQIVAQAQRAGAAA